MGGFSTIGAVGVAPHYLSDTTIHLGSLLRSQLEYPTVDVNLAYLIAINKYRHLRGIMGYDDHGIAAFDSFSDKAIERIIVWNSESPCRYVDANNHYSQSIDTAKSTADHFLSKRSGGTNSTLATESVDLGARATKLIKFSISGSTLKGFREDMTTPKISATDTAFASGYFGVRVEVGNAYISDNYSDLGTLRAPSSQLPPPILIIEVDVIKTPDGVYRPNLSQNLVEISSLTGLPDFLYQEAKKYEILRNKGFTDDEIKLVLGYIPQCQVDLDTVTWGAFEFSEKSATNIIVITGDNPYQSGAIDRQKSAAKRVFTPPKSYDDAVALYNKLKNDYPHWLAGKDNFAYQVLGYEELECLAVVDFYYGELIEHKTHYDQLKRVPDWELRNILRMWSDRLERAKPDIPYDEYVKHRNKLDKILRLGW